MNLEDLAKQDLFDYDQFEIPDFYDPYRNNNILKDSNKIPQLSTRPPFKSFYYEQKKIENQDKNSTENNRIGLKKLLKRLESMPSPDKKKGKSQNIKLKTISMMSSTQPIIIKKNKSIFVGTIIDDKNCENEKQKLMVKPSRPSTQHFGRSSIQSIFGCKNAEEMKVRTLIKRKLAEKNEVKMKNKTDKLINFLRENNNKAQAVKRNTLSTFKPASRKLINFLC